MNSSNSQIKNIFYFCRENKKSLLNFSLLIFAGIILTSLCAWLFLEWDQQYKLYFWEKYRYAAEQKYAKHNYYEARKLALQTVAQASHLGDDNFKLGVSLALLGKCYYHTGKLPEAKISFLKALVIFNNCLQSNDSPFVKELSKENKASLLQSLADISMETKQDRESFYYLKQACFVYRESCFDPHGVIKDNLLGQELVTCLCHFANMAFALNDPHSAEQSCLEAFKLAQLTAYPDFLLKDLRNNYIAFLLRQGRVEEAHRWQANVLWSQYYSEARAAYVQEDFPKAKKYFLRSIEQTHLTNTDYPELVKSCLGLANTYAKLGNWKLAKEACSDALAVRKYCCSTNSYDFDQLLCLHAFSCLNLKDPKEALVSASQLLDSRKDNYGDTSMQYAESLSLYARALFCNGQIEPCTMYLNKAWHIVYPKHLESKYAQTAINNIGSLSEMTGEFNRAQFIYKHCLAWNYARHRSKVDQLVCSYMNLCSLYCHWQKPDQVALYTSQLIDYLNKLPLTEKRSSLNYQLIVAQIITNNNYAEPANKLLNCITSTIHASDIKKPALAKLYPDYLNLCNHWQLSSSW